MILEFSLLELREIRNPTKAAAFLVQCLTLQYLSYKNFGSQTYLKTAGSIEAVLGFFSLYLQIRGQSKKVRPGLFIC